LKKKITSGAEMSVGRGQGTPKNQKRGGKGRHPPERKRFIGLAGGKGLRGGHFFPSDKGMCFLYGGQAFPAALSSIKKFFE